MDQLEALKFFVRLVEKRGIAAAGRDFGISPATASERLAQLERQYETKLVNRTTRSISLTDEGRMLLKGARALINESDDLTNRIRLGTSQVSGSIKISVAQDLGRSVIAPLLDAFLEDHPGVRIELHLEDKYLDIVGEGIDLAVRLGRAQDSSLRTRKLGENRRIVCAAPSYLATHGVPQHPEDLPAHNCLIMHWGVIIDWEWAFKIKGRKRVIGVSGDRSANNGSQVKQWCLAGHGLAFKSIWDVRDHLARGELVEVLQDFHFAQNSSLQLLYPGGYQPSRRVRALIDFLVAHFKDERV